MAAVPPPFFRLACCSLHRCYRMFTDVASLCFGTTRCSFYVSSSPRVPTPASNMAVSLRWALALACAAGVRGKHSTPPVYSSTSLGRRLAASPPVDGAVAHLRANPNPPNPTLTLALALARALTLARWLTSESGCAPRTQPMAAWRCSRATQAQLTLTLTLTLTP